MTNVTEKLHIHQATYQRTGTSELRALNVSRVLSEIYDFNQHLLTRRSSVWTWTFTVL